MVIANLSHTRFPDTSKLLKSKGFTVYFQNSCNRFYVLCNPLMLLGRGVGGETADIGRD